MKPTVRDVFKFILLLLVSLFFMLNLFVLVHFLVNATSILGGLFRYISWLYTYISICSFNMILHGKLLFFFIGLCIIIKMIANRQFEFKVVFLSFIYIVVLDISNTLYFSMLKNHLDGVKSTASSVARLLVLLNDKFEFIILNVFVFILSLIYLIYIGRFLSKVKIKFNENEEERIDSEND